MPDTRPRDPMPRDWSEAFAALPLDIPPAGGWQRLDGALPPVLAVARPPRWRRPALALVATMALAAVIPLMSWHAARQAPAQREHTATVVAPPAAAVAAPASADEPRAASLQLADTPSPARTPRATATSPIRSAPPPPAPARLDALYDESARLEALLARLTETEVANATALAVTADLQDQVTHIDLALSQPSLAADTRAALWEARVDTLRQLTGVEATQRWNVAFGDMAYASDTTVY